jgi:Icc-related predicted phosphoesterase
MLGKKRWMGLLGLILSMSGAAICIAAILVERNSQRPLPPYPVGNRPAFVEQLKERGLPFSFLVISDTHSEENGYALLKTILKKSNASFMIHVGDTVNGPSVWQHRYFLERMTGEIKPPFPVFLTPGNHDVYYGFQRVKEGERVTPEVYRSLYGAMSFDFTFNNCLFILGAVDLKKPEAFVDDLRSVLSAKAAGKKYIFLFLHFPPSAVAPTSYFPREKEFLSLLESFKVTSCFFGHYHGYRRRQINGTNLIVVGGGGGPLKSWQSEWGKFHHAMQVTVGEDGVTEDMMVLKKGGPYRHSLKWRIMVDILPLIEGRVWVVYVFAFALLWGVFFSFQAVRRAGRPERIL